MGDRMNQEQKFFVYTYSYSDGTPFYVGKGSGRRHRVHYCNAKAGRNLDSWNIRVIRKIFESGEEPIIKKIVNHIDEELAVLVEQEFISKYGRRDIGTGILVNCTDGGDGAVNLSPEIKAMQADILVRTGEKTRFKNCQKPWNTGKPMHQNAVEALRKANVGKKQTTETKIKKSLACKGYKHIQVMCPKCNTVGGETSMKRWHFDNCTGAKKFRARVTIDGNRIHLGRFATKADADAAVYDALRK